VQGGRREEEERLGDMPAFSQLLNFLSSFFHSFPAAKLSSDFVSEMKNYQLSATSYELF
jgi:hypothetical protein